ncbi:MAG: hypothetical protein WAX04_14425 [Oscillospiraceae bacterium]
MKKKKLIAVIIMCIIISNLAGCQSKKTPNNSSNIESIPSSSSQVTNNNSSEEKTILSNPKDGMYHYKSKVTAVSFDIMNMIEALPHHVKLNEILEIDKNSYYFGEDKYEGEYKDTRVKYVVSENRSLYGIDGIITYMFQSNGELYIVRFNSPNISLEQFKKMIKNMEQDMNVVLNPKIVDEPLKDIWTIEDGKFVYNDPHLFIATQPITIKINEFNEENLLQVYLSGTNLFLPESKDELSGDWDKKELYGVKNDLYNELEVTIHIPRTNIFL